MNAATASHFGEGQAFSALPVSKEKLRILENTRKVGLLWELSPGEGRLGPSYLLGTMHVRDQRAFGAFERATALLQECEVLALELDLGGPQAGRPEVPGGPALRALVSPGKLSRLAQAFSKQLGVDLNSVAHWPPSLVANWLQLQLLEEEQPLALDEALYEAAREMGKPVIGLESLGEQLEVMQRIPPAGSLQSILGLGRNLKAHRRAMRKMAESYAREDLPRLHRQAKRSIGGMRPLMLYDRNARMAQRLAAHASGQRVFAAVGAGHLWGGKGMLRHLKHLGYSIRPLP